jgi:hypothetical protein
MTRHRERSWRTRFAFLVLLLTAVTQLSYAIDPTWNYAVQASAQVQISPPRITLNWVQDSTAIPLSYAVSRKAPSDGSWTLLKTLSGSATNFADTNVSVGATYEYQIFKQASGYVGYGYIFAGIDAPFVEDRGTLLLIVDSTISAPLTNELARLQQDLIGDGWKVIRRDFSRDDSVGNVKSFIEGEYYSLPDVSCAFLFGHVPVPYSGDISPDEHVPAHRGAWPADVYYGDMTGAWTDSSVNDSGATDPRNRNVPGDGKFDQSTIPAYVDLEVGRVDLANMPGQITYNGPATFPGETELLRQYLNKDHKFRTKVFDLPRRGLIYDNFGNYGGEAFSASGWRNFASFFGPAGITYLPNAGTWLNTLKNNSYLWTYACGPGEYTGMNGPGNTGAYNQATTTDLVNADIRAAFTMLYGSWFGDWDSQDNFQRAVLATPTYGLVCCWSGGPHWFLQHMALGETIGFSARLVQNNPLNGLYRMQTNSYAHLIHVALMGDPTLRMHVVAPPTFLMATTNSSGVQLYWTPSNDSVLGYHVYRASDANGPFTRLTATVDTDSFYVDTNAFGQSFTYMVRALKLETSASGTYTNASEGIFVTVAAPSPAPVKIPMAVNSIYASSAGIVLTWSNQPGQVYDVLCKTNLLEQSWTDLNLNLSGGSATLSWTDAVSSAISQRFYRVVQLH